MSGPLRLRHRVVQSVLEHGLWSAGDRVAVAVSGGCDSTVLLDLLACTKAWHGAELSVVTVDHGTPHAADHARFVEKSAGELGLACLAVRVAPESSSEADLRAARYAVFEQVDADRVALAHHADDLAETVLLHLLRGTGIRGLRGMARRRGRFVRPLLDEPRAALSAWATSRELTWVEDPSNASLGPLRNRLRHQIFPQLEDARPGAGAAIARSARHAAEVDAWLTALAREHPPPWSADWVASGPPALVRCAILEIAPSLRTTGVDAVIAAARRGHGRVRAEGLEFRVEGGHVTVSDRAGV